MAETHTSVVTGLANYCTPRSQRAHNVIYNEPTIINLEDLIRTNIGPRGTHKGEEKIVLNK